MQVTFIVVGKTTGVSLNLLVGDYIKRLSNYLTFHQVVVKEEKFKSSIGIAHLKEQEANRIIKSIPKGDTVVLLDKQGSSFSSVGFSKYLFEDLALKGKNISFILGGAYGFSKQLYDKIPYKVSLSKMTLTHQMVRLLFIEQLYRACKIWKNEPYHH